MEKIKVLKRAKKWKFPKGLVHDFVKKSKFLLSFFFSLKLSQKRFVFDIYERKERF